MATDIIARGIASGANSSATTANSRIDSIVVGNPPKIDDTTKNWLVWNPDTNQYVDSGVLARGTNGVSGHSTYIGANGNWYIFNDTTQTWTDTGVSAATIQTSTMPTASAEYVNKVFQYIGETTSEYEQGLFYICELQGGTYSWNYLQVIQTASTSEFGAVKVQNGDLINITDGVLKLNTATGNYSMTVGGNASTTNASTNIGYNSSAFGWGSSAFGADAQVGTNAERVPGAIQLGRGNNTEAGTMSVGLSTNGSTWNNYKLLGNDGKVPLGMVTTVNNVITTDSIDPLAAGQGKLLNDRINNLENIGRFLAIWNCSTGLPLTNPTSLPYEYKTGDYYRVGAVAGTYTHTLSMAGNTTSAGTYEGTYTLSFRITTDSGTQLTTAAMVIAAMEDLKRYNATGTLVTADATYTVASVLKWTQDDTDYLALCDADESKLALVLASTTHTDTVTGGTVNYKPNGSTYTGTASVTVETEEVEIGWVYYYDGTTWLAQSAGAGGTVQDVQINGTSIVASDTGIANIPAGGLNKLGAVALPVSWGLVSHSSAAGYIGLADATDTGIINKVSKATNGYGAITPTNLNIAVREGLGNNSLTWPDAYKSSARNTIGAITMEEYDSTATPEDNVLYYVIED